MFSFISDWAMYWILAIPFKVRVTAVCVFAYFFIFALAAFGAEPIGPMVVEWRIVTTLEDVQKECGYKTPVKACWMKKASGKHIIVTLAPRGFKDHERWYEVMHELSHVELGCFHGPRGRYIGPQHDDEECRLRQTQ